MEQAASLPGEWSPHEGTLITWPGRLEVWRPWELAAAREYAQLVERIAVDEPVILLSDPTRLYPSMIPRGSNIYQVELASDDSWIRDNGPIFLTSACAGQIVDFGFNAWGNRFAPYDLDDALGRGLAKKLGMQRREVNFILEGGAISWNGSGVAVVVAECVLSVNRNGTKSRQDFERIVCDELDITTVLWLPYGLIEDLKNTDGHVDNVAVFTSADSLLLQTSPGNLTNEARLLANRHAAEAQIAEKELNIHLVECPVLPYERMPDGILQPAPYLNFVLTNGSAILPTVKSPLDGDATELFIDLFPGRRIEFTPATALTWGGGGPHCVTMQIPRGAGVLKFLENLSV